MRPGLIDVLLSEIDKDPGALDVVAERLAPLVAARLSQTQPATTDRWLDTRQAAEYLGLTYNALRKYTAERTVPFEQDTPGGKCWFKCSDLDAWRRGQWRPFGSDDGSNGSHNTARNTRARTRLRPVNTG